MINVKAGQTVECVLTPSSEGTIVQADLTCRLQPFRGAPADLTSTIEPHPTVAGSYRVRYVVPDAAVLGVWTFRWEHPDPAKMVKEDSEVQFNVQGSVFSDP